LSLRYLNPCILSFSTLSTTNKLTQSMKFSALRVASLNLFNFMQPPNAYYDYYSIYSEREWQGKCEWMLQHLRQVDAQLWGFQEVFSPAALNHIIDKIPGDWHFTATPETDLEQQDFVFQRPGLALASCFPINSVDFIQPSPSALTQAGLDVDWQFSRAPLRAIIQHPQLGPVRVYIVHFKSGRPMAITDIQVATPNRVTSPSTLETMGQWNAMNHQHHEARMLALDLRQQQLDRPLPTVVMGDFNNPLDHDALAPLLNDTGLESIWSQLSPPAPSPATHYYGSLGRVLDHILVSEHFCRSPVYGRHTQSARAQGRVRHAQVHDDHLCRPVHARDQFASDHTSVSAELEIL